MITDPASSATMRLCKYCRHFDNDPESIERSIQGLRVMGSGYSSVRSSDGLCGKRERYLSGDYSCEEFGA